VAVHSVVLGAEVVVNPVGRPAGSFMTKVMVRLGIHVRHADTKT
jgi:hypothetical protein